LVSFTIASPLDSKTSTARRTAASERDENHRRQRHRFAPAHAAPPASPHHQPTQPAAAGLRQASDMPSETEQFVDIAVLVQYRYHVFKKTNILETKTWHFSTPLST
jgi:hypothetical protein